MSEHSPDIEELTQDAPDAGAPGAGDQSAPAAEDPATGAENSAAAPQPDPPEVEAAKWKDYALRQQAELEN
ncbi:MAG: hypothetical protein KDN19_24540, partial [Verrucomicrobiae bacterium]|nr:hypothetical protein [Verrucomicrobiae bacterium]